MRDIDSTVNFMKDLLKHESSSRSGTASPAYSASAGASKDALLYKHSDEVPSTYKPSSRHLDRKSVRYAGEDSDAGLKDIRRKLENTSSMLEKSAEKSAVDEELEEEIETLQYRVKRIQEDIEYTSKGRRTAEKDEERRKLERELLFLMHEKLPELERRQERRREEKAMEERAGVRRRDARNKTHGRFDDRDRDRDEYERYRGTYDRDRDRSRERDRYDYDRDPRDRSRDRSRDRYDRYDRDRRDDRDRYDHERPRSPTGARSPPPAPPPPSASATASAPPPPPAPTSSSSVPSTKNMTPEERKAYIREQAQRRIQERLKALGVSSEDKEEEVDTSVQDRLEKEKQEAEEKSRKAEEAQKERDEARKRRLAEAGGGAAEPKSEEKPAEPAAPPLKSAMKKPAAPPPAPTPRNKAAPVPPPSRAHAAAPAAPPAAPTPPPLSLLRLNPRKMTLKSSNSDVKRKPLPKPKPSVERGWKLCRGKRKRNEGRKRLCLQLGKTGALGPVRFHLRPKHPRRKLDHLLLLLRLPPHPPLLHLPRNLRLLTTRSESRVLPLVLLLRPQPLLVASIPSSNRPPLPLHHLLLLLSRLHPHLLLLLLPRPPHHQPLPPSSLLGPPDLLLASPNGRTSPRNKSTNLTLPTTSILLLVLVVKAWLRLCSVTLWVVHLLLLLVQAPPPLKRQRSLLRHLLTSAAETLSKEGMHCCRPFRVVPS